MRECQGNGGCILSCKVRGSEVMQDFCSSPVSTQVQ